MITMKLKTIAATAALIVGATWAQGSIAAVVLSDNFNADAQMLNWAGDSSFTSLSTGGGSTDLIGTGFFDFYPGNGNYVDLDGSTGTGNNPVFIGHLNGPACNSCHTAGNRLYIP